MYEEAISLDVAKDGLESFVICPALGTLKSIRAGTLSPDVGIWTLGRPIFWNHLGEANLVSKELLSVLQSADELSIPDVGLDREFVDALISKLEKRLERVAEPNWYAEWGAPAKGS